MAPLQPVGPYLPHPVTTAERVRRERRHRDPEQPAGEDKDGAMPSDPGPEDPSLNAGAPAPDAAAPQPGPLVDPLDPDAPGHLFDVKA